MKRTWMRIWRHKWVFTGATLVIFLCVGAAAWAAGAGGSGATDPNPGSLVVAATTPASTGSGTEQPSLAPARILGPQAREALKERRQQRIERVQAVMGLVREKMTPEDQATYDRLVQEAKDEHAALVKAREDLAGTLKELRQLTDKYLGVTSAAAGAGPTTTVQ